MAQGGSPSSFELLFAEESGRLVRLATEIIGDADLATEVVQESFTRAYVRWTRLRHYDKPGAWLRRVTIRLAVRARQRREREQSVQTPVEPSWNDARPDLDLTRAVEALPATDRAVVVLHYLHDLPVDEVARALGIRHGTAAVRLHRARGRLVGLLSTEEIDDAV